MSLLYPENITLFLILPVIILFLVRAQKTREARYRRLNPEISPPNNLFGRIIMTSIFLGLLITALLRPFSGVTEVKKGATGSDNLVVLDISDSMRADDVKPSRLEAAKRKIMDLSQMLRERNPGDRIGIILFAGTAYMYCPPTVDYNALKQFVGYIRPELITAQGSAINEALRISSEVITRLKIKTPRLFLMTDGEDSGLAENAAAEALTDMGIKPLVLGFGTDSGAPLDIPGKGFIRDFEGKIVISKINQKALTKLTEATDGKFITATLSNNDLETLLNSSVNNKNTVESSGTIRVYNEFGHVFIWLALIVLLISVLARRHAPILALLLLLTQHAEAQTNTYEAWKAYQQGDYEAAKNGFESALKTDSTNEIKQALGSSYFKLGRYKDAVKMFKEITENPTSQNEAFEAAYNLGNAHLQNKEIDPAIRSYEDALKIRAKDTATKYNLEYAKKLKAEQQNQSREQKQENENQEKEEKDSQEQSQNNQEQQSNQEQNNQSQEEQQQTQNENNQQEPQQDQTKSQVSQQKDESKDNLQNESQQPKEQDTEKDVTPDKSEPNSSSEQKEQKELTEEDSSEAQEQPASSQEASKVLNEKELAEKEAERWLNSLPDAPVQIRRNQLRPTNRTTQTW